MPIHNFECVRDYRSSGRAMVNEPALDNIPDGLDWRLLSGPNAVNLVYLDILGDSIHAFLWASCPAQGFPN